jgi:TPR repeat protein
MKFASPSAAFNAATSAMQAGRADEAVRALEYAADKGMLDAIRKLARIYAAGEGVPKSDASAFGYYQRIADEFANISPRHPLAGHVAEAFVALATYYRNGLAELGLKPDKVHAARLYRHAASYFGDPSAQFALARMYLAGEGVNANVRLAVNWLANAAKKQHAPSQALLGDLLWQGKNDSYHQPLKGLALLTLARDNAAGTADAGWIEKLYARATGEAAPEQREKARGLAARWRGAGKGRNPGGARDSQASKEAGKKALSAPPKAPLAVTSANPVQSAPLAIRNAGTTESVQAQ